VRIILFADITQYRRCTHLQLLPSPPPVLLSPSDRRPAVAADASARTTAEVPSAACDPTALRSPGVQELQIGGWKKKLVVKVIIIISRRARTVIFNSVFRRLPDEVNAL